MFLGYRIYAFLPRLATSMIIPYPAGQLRMFSDVRARDAIGGV